MVNETRILVSSGPVAAGSKKVSLASLLKKPAATPAAASAAPERFSVTIPEISRDFRLLHWEGVAQ